MIIIYVCVITGFNLAFVGLGSIFRGAISIRHKKWTELRDIGLTHISPTQ